MDWLSLSELVDSLVELSDSLLSLSLDRLWLETLKLADNDSLVSEESECETLESELLALEPLEPLEPLESLELLDTELEPLDD